MPSITALRLGLGLMSLLVRELTSLRTQTRRPEPAAAMEDAHSVDGFHDAGAEALTPVYHLNALALSHLMPPGGTLVDLGSGSGRFLAYLAQRRPDLRIIGLELSATMVNKGQHFLAGLGLEGRVSMRQGDMTAFADAVPDGTAVVSSVFSLHHLPAPAQLGKCLREINAVRQRLGSGVWIFDFVRPRHPQTAARFPYIATPGVAPAFNLDTTNSLIASWSYQEMHASLAESGLAEAHHALSHPLRLYQTHWREAKTGGEGHACWVDVPLSPELIGRCNSFKRLFSDLPG